MKGAGYHELKNAWKNNDAEGKGFGTGRIVIDLTYLLYCDKLKCFYPPLTVTRDVFRIILSKLLNRDVSLRQVELLLQVLEWSHKRPLLLKN